MHYALFFFQMNPGHQPQRFEYFTELQDGSGFTIKGSEHVYLYDRYGGWYDQHGNYYDENGQPDDPPSSESYSDEGRRSMDSSCSDQFQREFGRPRQESSESASEGEENTLEAIAHNLLNLQIYPPGQWLRIYFHNLHPTATRQQLLQTYNSQVDNGLVNAIIDRDQSGNNIGTGYFIALPDAAERVVKLEGERLMQRALRFQIQEYQNFLLFPIEEREFQKSRPKKYVLKKPEQEKEREVVKKEDVWRWYKFQKDIFLKKSEFQSWMLENGFNPNDDFRNLQKAQKGYVKVQMKESTYLSANGLEFNGKRVDFSPL